MTPTRTPLTEGIKRLNRIQRAKERAGDTSPEPLSAKRNRAKSEARFAARVFYDLSQKHRVGDPIGVPHYADVKGFSRERGYNTFDQPTREKRHERSRAWPHIRKRVDAAARERLTGRRPAAEPRGLASSRTYSRQPLLIESLRRGDVGHPIMTPALKLAAARGNLRAAERNQAGVKAFETARYNLMRRKGETFEPVKVVSGELAPVKKMRLHAMARAERFAKAGRTPFDPGKKVQVASRGYARRPLLAEGLPLPGQTIAGGIAPQGATTTANTGFVTTDGKWPNYGPRTLKAMERQATHLDRCYKKAQFSRKRQEKCDEIPVKTGGVIPVISRKRP